MFTGLVQELGRVRALERSERGVRIAIDAPLASRMREGDSVSVSGVCLTATELGEDSFVAEAMNETLARSSLGQLRDGDEVNLELAVRAGDPLGGHIVQGHVDGTGRVLATSEDGFALTLEIEASEAILRYLVPKGSIAVEGVSLTVTGVDGASFTVSLIPETLKRTNLARSGPGSTVNLEVDVLAKYVERLMGART